VISGLHHMDRGYSDLEGKMRGLGARLERTLLEQPVVAA
jgi:UDP-N-acetylglucosamine enolpyruvyl transferase